MTAFERLSHPVATASNAEGSRKWPGAKCLQTIWYARFGWF